MPSFLKKVNDYTTILCKILHPKGTTSIFIAIFVGIFIGIIEYGVAGLIQLFLVKLDLMPSTKLHPALQEMANYDLSIICITLVAASFFRVFGKIILAVTSTVTKEIMFLKLRNSLVLSILSQGNNVSQLTKHSHALNGEVFPRSGAFVLQATRLIAIFTQIIFLFVGLSLLAPYESAIGVSGLLVIGLSSYVINRKIKIIAKKSPQFYKNFSNILSGISKNRIFLLINRHQQNEFKKFESPSNSYYSNNVRLALLSSFSSGFPELLGIVMLSFIIMISQIYFDTDGATLIAFFYLFIRFIQQIGVSLSVFSALLTFKPHLTEAINIYKNYLEEFRHDYFPFPKFSNEIIENTPPKNFST